MSQNVDSTLIQLRKFAYAVKNSTTLLLPEWNNIVKRLAADTKKSLSLRVMPRDVTTRWNSTYDMLKFAYTYREAINQLTDNRSLNLGKCRITNVEWNLVQQLWDTLKVSRRYGNVNFSS
jgi:hypothetical protein